MEWQPEVPPLAEPPKGPELFKEDNRSQVDPRKRDFASLGEIPFLSANNPLAAAANGGLPSDKLKPPEEKLFRKRRASGAASETSTVAEDGGFSSGAAQGMPSAVPFNAGEANGGKSARGHSTRNKKAQEQTDFFYDFSSGDDEDSNPRIRRRGKQSVGSQPWRSRPVAQQHRPSKKSPTPRPPQTPMGIFALPDGARTPTKVQAVATPPGSRHASPARPRTPKRAARAGANPPLPMSAPQYVELQRHHARLEECRALSRPKVEQAWMLQFLASTRGACKGHHCYRSISEHLDSLRIEVQKGKFDPFSLIISFRGLLRILISEEDRETLWSLIEPAANVLTEKMARSDLASDESQLYGKPGQIEMLTSLLHLQAFRGHTVDSSVTVMYLQYRVTHGKTSAATFAAEVRAKCRVVCGVGEEWSSAVDEALAFYKRVTGGARGGEEADMGADKTEGREWVHVPPHKRQEMQRAVDAIMDADDLCTEAQQALRDSRLDIQESRVAADAFGNHVRAKMRDFTERDQGLSAMVEKVLTALEMNLGRDTKYSTDGRWCQCCLGDQEDMRLYETRHICHVCSAVLVSEEADDGGGGSASAEEGGQPKAAPISHYRLTHNYFHRVCDEPACRKWRTPKHTQATAPTRGATVPDKTVHCNKGGCKAWAHYRCVHVGASAAHEAAARQQPLQWTCFAHGEEEAKHNACTGVLRVEDLPETRQADFLQQILRLALGRDDLYVRMAYTKPSTQHCPQRVRDSLGMDKSPTWTNTVKVFVIAQVVHGVSIIFSYMEIEEAAGPEDTKFAMLGIFDTARVTIDEGGLDIRLATAYLLLRALARWYTLVGFVKLLWHALAPRGETDYAIVKAYLPLDKPGTRQPRLLAFYDGAVGLVDLSSPWLLKLLGDGAGVTQAWIKPGACKLVGETIVEGAEDEASRNKKMAVKALVRKTVFGNTATLSGVPMFTTSCAPFDVLWERAAGAPKGGTKKPSSPEDAAQRVEGVYTSATKGIFAAKSQEGGDRLYVVCLDKVRAAEGEGKVQAAVHPLYALQPRTDLPETDDMLPQASVFMHGLLVTLTEVNMEGFQCPYAAASASSSILEVASRTDGRTFFTEDKPQSPLKKNGKRKGAPGAS